MTFYRPTWVEISLPAFSHNVRHIKKVIGPSVDLWAVLKADAYGHGATPLANVALKSGAAGIGVSSLEEGIALRDAGVRAPILILGGIYPFKNYGTAFSYRLIPTVASFDSARQLKDMARKKRRPLPFHFKVDTGMGRIGQSVQAGKRTLSWIKSQPELDLKGIYSHLSTADSDPGFYRAQRSRFLEIVDHAHKVGFKKCKFHLANSDAVFKYPESHFDLVRPGLSLYGASLVSLPETRSLTPVLRFVTKIVFMKKVKAGFPVSYGRTFVTRRVSEIATLPVGYADGIPRAVSNKAEVLIQGKRCPVIGRVTMDHVMVDLTGVRAQIGAPVVLIGAQDKEIISVEEWARWANTISYEIFCGISKRVPRVIKK